VAFLERCALKIFQRLYKVKRTAVEEQVSEIGFGKKPSTVIGGPIGHFTLGRIRVNYIWQNLQTNKTNSHWLITKTNPFNIFETPGDFRSLLSLISNSQSRVQFYLETHLLHNCSKLCVSTDIVLETTLMSLTSPQPYLLWPSQLSLGASFQRKKVLSWLKAPGWSLLTRR